MKAAARITPAFRPALLRQPVPRAALAGPSQVRGLATEVAEPAPVAEVQAIPNIEIPANLTFVDMAPATKKQSAAALRELGFPLHKISRATRYDDIDHPLSSLASDHPTHALPSGETILLPRDVFNMPLRKDILHRNVTWFLANMREGNQHTKKRSTIAYSGRKIRAQKGSGKARLGDRGAGTLRGGAPIFPLSPRDWSQKLPRKVQELGLRTALSAKLREGFMRIVPDLNEGMWAGTNSAIRALGDGLVNNEWVHRFGPRPDLSILFVHAPSKDKKDVAEFWRTVRNHPGIDMMSTDEIVVYDLLKYRWVVLEADVVDVFAGNPFAGVECEPALAAQLEEMFASQIKL
ncbi:hypothetical protein CspHIS471_0402350 [Cutaneotrichosporon sp. HIS471]|nr:hypothetical protein CspHIS471_0402350 [Cutaneotrichosporon sp. HIS471]